MNVHMLQQFTVPKFELVGLTLERFTLTNDTGVSNYTDYNNVSR